MLIKKIQNNIIHFLKINNVIFTAFITSFIIFMVYCLIRNNTTFYYDSISYWSLSNNFYYNGEFSLTKFFPQSIRGYFFPMLLFVFRGIGLFLFKNGFVGLYLINSISFSIILTILVRFLSNSKSFSILKTIILSSIFSLLIIVFYRSMLIYPLSDNIAIMLFLLAIFFSLKQFNNNLLNNIKYIFVGSLLYGCYNTRPAYLISIIIFIIAWCMFEVKSNVNFIKNVICIFLGIIPIALPQMIINNIYLHTYSPMIIFSIGGSKNLNLLQLYLGLGCNSYETVVAPLNNYAAIPGLMSPNKTGEIIKAVENITPDNISYLTIIKLIFKYPFEMIGIYFSHLINILFIFDEECYVKDMSRNLSLNFFISFMVIYLNGLFLSTYKNEKKMQEVKKYSLLQKLKSIDKEYIYFFIPAICGLLTIPGQIETRFFIYIHIIMYFTLCFVINYSELFRILKKHYIKIAISCMVLIGAFSSICSYNLAAKPSDGLTFSLNPYAINIEKEITNQIEQNLIPYIPKSEVYENGYLPPDFSFITKTGQKGEISFSIIFDKEITEQHNIQIFIDGEVKNLTSEIKKGTYDFKFTVEPNKIHTVNVKSSYLYTNESGKKVSFKLNNLKIQ